MGDDLDTRRRGRRYELPSLGELAAIVIVLCIVLVIVGVALAIVVWTWRLIL